MNINNDYLITCVKFSALKINCSYSYAALLLSIEDL